MRESAIRRIGDSYDNALAERIIGLFKAEVIWRRSPWRNDEDVEFATPVEFEERYYADKKSPVREVGLN